MGKIVLASGSARRGFRLSWSHILTSNWTTHIKPHWFISKEEKKVYFVAWSSFTGHEKVLLVWQTRSLIFIRKIQQSGMWDTETDRKMQGIDCTDSLTHHMPHWLSSCYQSVCISPTLHGLPVLVNMPHTRYPTAWKRVQRSTKNLLISDHCNETLGLCL